MRLEILCQDRLGIAQEVLNILALHQISLRGIEVDLVGIIYLNLPDLAFTELQKLLPEIRHIKGVTDVRTIPFMPSEREHYELSTLLQTLPDPVISVDIKGNIIIVNESGLRVLGGALEEVRQTPISQWLQGFNFSRWIQQSEHWPMSIPVKVQGDAYLADILPIHVPNDQQDQTLVGVVICLKSADRLGKQIHALQQVESSLFSEILAVDTEMRRIVKQAKKFAGMDAPLQILGETGTGKELLARACHSFSVRAEKPFLVLNCASLPDNVAETELFGYVERVTGQEKPIIKHGMLEQADGGTIFLDEIGEMSSHLQIKFLRFLQDGTFRRVGDDKEVKVNIRVICSTQKNLPQLCQEGLFREDLFYRLNVLIIHLPPLRERRKDIIPLAEMFIRRYASQQTKVPPKLSKAAINLMLQYPWPGNIRQLEHTILRAITVLEKGDIRPEHMQLPSYADRVGYLSTSFEGTLEESVKNFEKQLLTHLYPAYPSSRQLAKKLGVSHTAIARKLRDYGITKNSQ
ncbi:transcriptional regulator TyrR [Zooshikella ganghwensis]|uniref:transcriptional regulator TyrR n=1 Tax=Zooshikella ganghwensis TaxID=202772 RepID=UPI000484BECF|nr:transcriptional regulator TyrR [Zooshikella ganghwensis]